MTNQQGTQGQYTPSGWRDARTKGVPGDHKKGDDREDEVVEAVVKGKGERQRQRDEREPIRVSANPAQGVEEGERKGDDVEDD